MAKAKAKARKPVSDLAAQDSTAILKELEMIRRLLMLLAVKIGSTGPELGVALGVSKQRVSQLIAAGKIDKLSFNYSPGADND
jgi:hypothetical protein